MITSNSCIEKSQISGGFKQNDSISKKKLVGLLGTFRWILMVRQYDVFIVQDPRSWLSRSKVVSSSALYTVLLKGRKVLTSQLYFTKAFFFMIHRLQADSLQFSAFSMKVVRNLFSDFSVFESCILANRICIDQNRWQYDGVKPGKYDAWKKTFLPHCTGFLHL